MDPNIPTQQNPLSPNVQQQSAQQIPNQQLVKNNISSSRSKLKIILIIILLLAIGLALAGGVYFFLDKKTPEQAVCTQEEKICPDGSVVGRAGRNCQFTECSAAKIDKTSDWKVYEDKKVGFKIKYPNNWNITFSYPMSFQNYSVDDLKENKLSLDELASIQLLIKPGFSSIDEWLNEFDKMNEALEKVSTEAGKTYEAEVQKEEINIGNLRGYKVVVQGKEKGKEESCLASAGVFKDGKLYELEQLEPLGCGNYKILIQMFSSLEFLE